MHERPVQRSLVRPTLTILTAALLLGSGAGAWLAAIVAALDARVAFLIALAGHAVTGAELLAVQAELGMRASAVAEDPSGAWSGVDAPVLSMFRGLDTQVDLQQNREPLEDALADNGDVTIEVIEDANDRSDGRATARAPP